MNNTIIPIGDYDWIVLHETATKYLVVSEDVLFNGFYASKMCQFHQSKLNDFLTRKFLPKLAGSDVDMRKISGLAILSKGQFDQFVKNKLPDTVAPYMLLTPYPDKEDYIYAVTTDGLTYPHHVLDLCGIRPCLYIDKAYADSLIFRDDYADNQSRESLTDISPTDEEIMGDTAELMPEESEAAPTQQKEEITEQSAAVEEKPDTEAYRASESISEPEPEDDEIAEEQKTDAPEPDTPKIPAVEEISNAVELDDDDDDEDPDSSETDESVPSPVIEETVPERQEVLEIQEPADEETPTVGEPDNEPAEQANKDEGVDISNVPEIAVTEEKPKQDEPLSVRDAILKRIAGVQQRWNSK